MTRRTLLSALANLNGDSLTRFIPTLLMLSLAGCAATYTEPALPADHPANGAATGSQPHPRSRTLDLAEAEPVTPAPAVGGALYACPMHPEVTSDKPDQRCPRCGMKLLKVESHTGGPR